MARGTSRREKPLSFRKVFAARPPVARSTYTKSERRSGLGAQGCHNVEPTRAVVRRNTSRLQELTARLVAGQQIRIVALGGASTRGQLQPVCQSDNRHQQLSHVVAFFFFTEHIEPVSSLPRAC